MILAVVLLAVAAIAGALYLTTRPVTLRIAVGPPASEDYKLIQAMAQSFVENGSKVRLSLITTEGPFDSASLLAAHQTDLAVARADFEMSHDVGSIAVLRKNFVVLWSRSKGSRKGANSKIKEIEDLKGRRVGVVGRTQANVTLLRIILKESGVDPEKVAIVQFGTDQINEMAHDPTIDAFMTVGPLIGKLTVEAIALTARAGGEPTFLSVDVSEAIAKKYPIYESEEIPRSSFNSSPARPDDKIETIAVDHLIVAPTSLSETTVSALTRQVFDIRQSLAREMQSASNIEKPNTDKDAAIPAHPGAAAYIDGTERTFLEKYSDYLWGGIVLLSLLGSASAWLRHYLKRNERDRNTLHRDKLVATISKVRQAASLDELASVQCEVDGLLRETLDCYDDGAIEEGDLLAFNLVLNQFHHAIVDRSVALGAPSPELPRLRVR